MTNIVVIGGGGFIGSQLLRAFAVEHNFVTAITRTEKNENQVADVNYVNDSELTKAASISALESAHIIFYCSTSTTPAQSASSAFLEVNSSLIHFSRLLDLIKSNRKTRVILFSSAGTVYGESANGAHKENHPLQPISFHGAMKSSCELFLQAACNQFGYQGITIRASNVYGPEQRQKGNFGIVPTLLTATRHTRKFNVFGTGGERRDYLFIDDLIQLCLACATAIELPNYAVFNASYGESTSTKELIQIVESVTNTSISLSYTASGSYQIGNIQISNEKARQMLNWSPQVALHQGIAKTWNWYLENCDE